MNKVLINTKTFLTVLVLMSSCFMSKAQEVAANGGVEMADTMRQNGKINVVIAVLLIIFTGIIIYLVSIDRKLSRFEKDSNKKNN